MRFAAVHKVCSYLMIAAAFTALALSGELPPILIGLVALLGFGSFFVDPADHELLRGRAWATAWNVLIITATFLSALLLFRGEGLPVVGAQFLCLLAINKLWNRQRSRDYLQLYVISFLMLVVGTVLNTELIYALCFVAYVVLATWTLTLFHLRREMEDNYLLKHSDGGSERVAVDRIFNSRRVIGGSFLAASSAMSIAIFLGSTVFFFLFPRIGFNLFGQHARRGMQVGFNDRGVELGGNGLIKDNEQVVMRVEFPEGRPRDPLYFRGISFDRYESGRWSPSRGTLRAELLQHRGTVRLTSAVPDAAHAMKTALRQNIYLEPMDSSVLFAASTPIGVDVPGSSAFVASRPVVLGGWLDGVARGLPTNDMYIDGRQSGIRYTAFSSTAAPAPFELDAIPALSEKEAKRLAPYLDASTVPLRVAELARSIVGKEQSPHKKVQALVAYLGRGFNYSLELHHLEGKEPVEEFLFERRAGHCEYFASALALMARAVGVPTRHVAGFYAGEWNEVGHYLQVRQRDAHAWVEVYLGTAGWVTVDATPAVEFGDPNSYASRMRQLFDLAQLAWFKYIIEYDLGTQIDLVGRARRYFSGMKLPFVGGTGGGAWFREHRRELERGGLAIIALTVVAFVALRIRASSATRQPHEHRAGRALDTALRALARRGLARKPSETLVELASRARAATAADALDELVAHYYAARYGNRPVDTARLDRLAEQVARPSPPASRTTARAV